MNWRRITLNLFICTLLGGQLWAIFRPIENWPFSSGTMFAYYAKVGDPLHTFSFSIQRNQRWRPLNARSDLGLSELQLRRLFFSNYYGSSDPYFPQGHHLHDTPARYQRRLVDFAEKALGTMKIKQRPAEALRIQLHILKPDGTSETDRITLLTHPTGPAT